MLGPYTALKNKVIGYKGNKIFSPVRNISSKKISVKHVHNRVNELKNSHFYTHIARINHCINSAVNEYFDKLGSVFTLLPLTTRMISSPGAVYGKEALDYTSDTVPIKLKWFNLPNHAFLSESSQIYLELALLQPKIQSVYSIYNSFRKEKADITHLSEFHHIEYEGKVTQIENEKIALNLIKFIIGKLLKHGEENLAFFLDSKKLNELEEFSKKLLTIPCLTFEEVLKLLYQDTKEKKYLRFTSANFGSWEEIKLTEIIGNMVMVKEFPLLEVPFYHAHIKDKKPLVAENADIIWPGYREIVGSGHRVRSKNELENKAKIFNLPKDDYHPYLQSRNFTDYCETSGFGLGWERILQGLLEMPFITNVAHFPRIDLTLKP